MRESRSRAGPTLPAARRRLGTELNADGSPLPSRYTCIGVLDASCSRDESINESTSIELARLEVAQQCLMTLSSSFILALPSCRGTRAAPAYAHIRPTRTPRMRHFRADLGAEERRRAQILPPAPACSSSLGPHGSYRASSSSADDPSNGNPSPSRERTEGACSSTFVAIEQPPPSGRCLLSRLGQPLRASPFDRLPQCHATDGRRRRHP